MSYEFGLIIGGVLPYALLVALGLWLWFAPSPWSFSVFVVYAVALIKHEPPNIGGARGSHRDPPQG